MEPQGRYSSFPRRRPVFYGWYIVGVGVLSNIASVFSFSSTLSVFLKPVSEDLGVSRGAFSLVRTGEILVNALIVPFIGPVIDRHGGRWLIATGAVIASAGYLLLSQVQEFWQFLLGRCSVVVVGDTLMNSLVTVIISRWFVRKRGRAIAIASMGTGVAKVSMPLLATSLFVWVGWRHTWAVFGILTLVLVVAPAIAFLRRSPEDLALHPDGEPLTHQKGRPLKGDVKLSATQRQALAADVVWSRGEVVRTQAFWLLIFTFGIVSIGIAGLNLHMFAFVTDLGYPPITAAALISTLALTQFGSTLFWGFLAERIDIRKAAVLQFLLQALGLTLAIAFNQIHFLYAGFAIYGIGLGGGFVLREVIWANYYGRLSLGTVRGTGMLFSNAFAASGAPFFGFLFDAMGSYFISFAIFVIALFTSAVLIMFVQPPKKITSGALS